MGTRALHSKERLRPSSQISSWTYSPKLLSAVELAADRSIRRNAPQIGGPLHVLRVTVASRRDGTRHRDALPRPRRFIDFHVIWEGSATVWAEEPRSWMMREASASAGIALNRIIFPSADGFRRRFGRGLVALASLASFCRCLRFCVALLHAGVTRFKLSPWQGGFVRMNPSAH